ncbi:hypothetical protein CLL_A1401 [Clostridium botulinum B str. Eklund 17B (NRP)]|uniref:Uncharacterized protein n=1 Tax=Clostridium botulinum (strain Eklund 17B / Type B) TaxID=935198 RepID=B2TJI7_CLOBB|nr:hypothetical protein CLL_A1401 [Clostridium botulinum B str. Eklund 17B (NRP)]
MSFLLYFISIPPKKYSSGQLNNYQLKIILTQKRATLLESSSKNTY